jgi:hypothetical protein
MSKPNKTDSPELFFVDPEYRSAFDKLGLTSVDAVFSFDAGVNLSKNNLADFRTRLRFEIDSPRTVLFLKRYDRPPISAQIKSWLAHRAMVSCSGAECTAISELTTANIRTPRIVAHGEQWGLFFEQRSFLVTEKIPNAESLERKAPNCFMRSVTAETLKLRRDFIHRLASFVRQFHATGYRHRDLYFSHIFHDGADRFYLIDLARAFKPAILRERFRVKDIAQLHYSAPAKYFSRTDRLRFYKKYADTGELSDKDKAFIRRVTRKARRIRRHDSKRNRTKIRMSG